MGVRFDAWQDGAGQVILSKRDDGSYACSVGGVVISIPRQVGKTFLIGAIVFALCMLNPGLKVLWTAHHTATADQTFESLQGFARKRRIKPHVAKVLIDAMTVSFRNGSQIMFGARERGFGRGIPGVGVLVFDEAQILTEKAAADMVPTTNTVQDALVIYTGTPPKPSDPSELFSNRRDEALAGDSDDMAYIEFSADDGADPLDREQWAKANPSYPARTNEAAMLRMKKNLTPDSYLREALGIWSATTKVQSVISPDLWADLGPHVPPLGDTHYGVKFSTDGRTVAVAVAVRPDEGPVHVEGVHHRSLDEGTKWLEDWLVARWRHAALIVVDGGGAGALVLELRKRGVPARRVHRPTVDEVMTAHSMIATAVIEETLTHNADDAVAAAVASAGQRKIGKNGGWGFQSIDGGDVTLLEAITFAHFGTQKKKPKSREGGDRRSGRKAVVL